MSTEDLRENNPLYTKLYLYCYISDERIPVGKLFEGRFDVAFEKAKSQTLGLDKTIKFTTLLELLVSEIDFDDKV